MNKYEASYRHISSYMTTLEKILQKEQTALIKDCKANMYSLVRKENGLLPKNIWTSAQGIVYGKCVKCNDSVNDTMSYCSKCGFKIDWSNFDSTN